MRIFREPGRVRDVLSLIDRANYATAPFLRAIVVVASSRNLLHAMHALRAVDGDTSSSRSLGGKPEICDGFHFYN